MEFGLDDADDAFDKANVGPSEQNQGHMAAMLERVDALQHFDVADDHDDDAKRMNYLILLLIMACPN